MVRTAMAERGPRKVRCYNLTIPRNGSDQVAGSWTLLNTSQVDLLGLVGQANFLVPVLSPQSYSSLIGPGPVSFQVAFGNAFNSATAWAEALTTLFVYDQNPALGNVLLSAEQEFLPGVLSAVAAAIQAALGVLFSLLGELFDAILAFAKQLAETLISPIVYAAEGLADCVNQQVRQINYDTSNGMNQSASDLAVSALIWGCIGGPIFLAGVLLGVTLLIVLSILEGFTFGATYFIVIVFNLVVIAALAILQDPGARARLGEIASATTSLGVATASFTESVANNTTGHAPPTNNSTLYRGYGNNTTISGTNWLNYSHPNLQGTGNAASESNDWTDLGKGSGSLLILLLDYKGSELGIQTLRTALVKGNAWDEAFNFVSMGLSLVSLMIDLGALSLIPTPRLASFGLVIGGTALIIAGSSYLYSLYNPDLGVQEVDDISLALSGVSFVASLVLYSRRILTVVHLVMTDPIEVDIRALNYTGRWNRPALRMIPVPIAVIIAGLYFGVIRFVLVTDGSTVANSSNNPSIDLAVAAFSIGMGLVLLVPTLVAGAGGPVAAKVDDTSLEFRFNSGRTKVFRWDDPRLNLRFLEYVANRQDPDPGHMRTILWMGFTRYGIPPEFLQRVCFVAKAHGVYITQTRRTMTAAGSTLTLLSRQPPALSS